MPFSICLFALVLELEERALQWIDREALASWQCLSENRQKLACKTFLKRYRSRPSKPAKRPIGFQLDLASSPDDQAASLLSQVTSDRRARDLLGNTMFIDRLEIIRRRGLIKGMTKDRIKRVSGKAERLRNQCAHASYSQIFIERERLWDLVEDIHLLMREIVETGRLDEDLPLDEQRVYI